MVLPDGCEEVIHVRRHQEFMVVMKHILTGLQHGSPKRDAP